MNKADEILGGGQGGGNTNTSGLGNVAHSGGKTEGNFSGDTKSTPHWIKGAASLAGRYWLPATKAIGRATLRTAATMTGVIGGFAGGVAKGDISEALKGAVAGGAIGDGLAKGGINFASNLPGNVKKIGNEIQDTYNEGAYGAEYAQNIKMVREFKQTSDYKELRQKYGDQLTDEKLSEILKAAQENQK